MKTLHPAHFAPFHRSSKFQPYHFAPAAPERVERSESNQQRRAKDRTNDRRANRTLKHQPAILVALPTVYVPPTPFWSY